MYVNIKIVNALLTLRGLSLQQIAGVTGISLPALRAWLAGEASDNDERLSFERQLEVIKVLGIVGEHPRSDVTHSWYLREPAFGNREATYEPLRLMLLCFGRCEVTHIAQTRDPMVSFSARSYFGLTFEKFRAVLEISFSPLRTLSFDPRQLPNMHWVGEQAPLIVQDETFLHLVTPGETSPAALDRERVKALAPARWARLAELAEERGLGVSDLARYLIENVPVQAALTHEPEAKAEETPAAKPELKAEETPAAPKPGDLFFEPQSPVTIKL